MLESIDFRCNGLRQLFIDIFFGHIVPDVVNFISALFSNVHFQILLFLSGEIKGKNVGGEGQIIVKLACFPFGDKNSLHNDTISRIGLFNQTASDLHGEVFRNLALA